MERARQGCQALLSALGREPDKAPLQTCRWWWWWGVYACPWTCPSWGHLCHWDRPEGCRGVEEGVSSSGGDDGDRGRRRGWGDERTRSSCKIWTQTLETRKNYGLKDGISHLAGVNEPGHTWLIKVQSQKGPRVRLTRWVSLHRGLLGIIPPLVMLVREWVKGEWEGGELDSWDFPPTCFRDSYFCWFSTFRFLNKGSRQ